jgi:hypothetical protein
MIYMKNSFQHALRIVVAIGFPIFTYSCKKLVTIPPPVNTITTTQAFQNDLQATEAMLGVYNTMLSTGNSSQSIFAGGATFFCAASADELSFYTDNNTIYDQFQSNQLLPTNSVVSVQFWNSAYSTIYGCNSVIAGVQNSGSIHDSVKSELIGEAEFVRAFSYFYLVNLFGEVPLVTTINYDATSLLGRSEIDTIYSQIFADLKDAQLRLPTDYSVGNGQRIIPNRWATTALLARVYLYKGDWVDAANEATTILNNSSLYGLVLNLDSVFSANSNEAIWQLQQSNQVFPFNATPEGSFFIPSSQTGEPNMYLTSELLGAFEVTDMRRMFWVDSTIYMGQTYYYPYKYRIGPSQEVVNGFDSSYYMVLRVGEQFLIRAEAEANGANGGIVAAVLDLNAIRQRAGLAAYSGSQAPDSVMSAIQHEWQIEFFAEWGHRWLDLKRWGTASSLLSSTKGITVTTSALLYPIPTTELSVDPNLTQNQGY